MNLRGARMAGFPNAAEWEVRGTQGGHRGDEGEVRSGRNARRARGQDETLRAPLERWRTSMPRPRGWYPPPACPQRTLDEAGRRGARANPLASIEIAYPATHKPWVGP